MAADFSREGMTKLLGKYGIRVAEEGIARSPKEAAAFARKFGYPVVLKIVSDEIIHKSDAGCVKTNIVNEHDLLSAYAVIMRNAGKARVQGMLVQKMARKGLELIVGGKKDPQFGPLILFGIGGIFVEVFRDVSLRVCPITKADALEMMDEIKGAPLLKGVRGTVPVDREKLAQLLVSVSKMLYENQGICELDLNPVIAYADGYLTVDVRVIRCATEVAQLSPKAI